ncbi:RNA-associated protein 21 homolog [Seminavis robusta]|uniref:RNA-associated protein 21 homolog n=1 Tax=Seminavis robusta TaxID=568900 RepID=A0A9N8HTU0_9STRA|nr:RNA-associated protein 21 homolog [Seminavis robusta]|eukprot:Sro1313_g261950.1 RNA-associated protein 21 homolog (1337) ;mRNA; r:18965-22975
MVSPKPQKRSPSSASNSSSSKKAKKKMATAVENDEKEAPQPVSSDDDNDTQDEWEVGIPKADTPTNKMVLTKKSTCTDNESKAEMSRLFAPYRTVGIVSSGTPFYLMPHQNSASAMLCLPIGERFHILQCDKLQPVLVSQKVPAIHNNSHNKKKKTQKPQHIAHMVSDATLSISAVAHGPKQHAQLITLYSRTRPLQTLPVQHQQTWNIVDLLHLGRTKVPMKGEKEGKMENAAIIAAILSRHHTTNSNNNNNPNQDQGVDVVGDSSDDDSDSSEGDSDSQSSNDTSSPNCHCQVVIYFATRDSLKLHKRISLTTQPDFVPQVAMHPSTYVNKIVMGGYTIGNDDDNQRAPALSLLNIRSGKVVHVFKCIGKSKKLTAVKRKDTTVTTLEQSPAVDTVAVGTDGGKVHLINLRHDKTLFTLMHKPRDGSSKPVSITSISFRTDGSAMNYGIAPMAVGRSDGSITVWNLNPPDDEDDEDDERSNSKKERTILTEMYNVHLGGISKLMFLPQEPLLVSIGKHSNSVLMHIFDNPDHSGRILRQRKGHTAAPAKIEYLHPGAAAGGGIMVNMSDGTDASACQILSSGSTDRTLRVFSTARTVLDKEYSQGKGLEKRAKKLGMDSTAELLLPRLTGMAMSEARSRDWGDLVTIHEQHSIAYVWSTKRGAQWGPVLRQTDWNVSAMKAPPPPSTHAVSIAMSACGNFAVVGTKGGVIYKYNVQSGNPRGSYPRDAGEGDDGDGFKRKRLQPGDVKRTMKSLEKKMKISNRASNLDKRDQDAVQEALVEQRRQAKLKLACHSGYAVAGLAVDSTNKTMISVGADAKLILWNFATHAPHKKSPYQLPSPATLLCHVRDSDLAAIALEDFSTLLFDCTTLSIVRRFGGGSTAELSRHSGPISDIGFSPDGRTLYTGSLDGTVRVWDVPTNTCIDWLGFETPPTSLTVSPTGEFLATSHMGKLGLSIWSDRSFYQTVNVNGAKELEEPFRMDEPKPIAEVWEQSDDPVEKAELPKLLKALAEKDGDNEAEESPDDKLPAPAKQKGLVTLSNLPPAHWKNLFHLELIKERNKPKEAPKKPPSAPFFLQWRGGDSVGPKPAESTEEEAKETPNDEDEWKAAWSDDDDEGAPAFDESMADVEETDGQDAKGDNAQISSSSKKRELEKAAGSKILSSSNKKRIKISHHRSHLATLLHSCSEKASEDEARRFQEVTDHIATLGPSAIDVALSSLCNGMHDLEEGLPLLRMACMWLIEACESRERYEAVNAYLHRFLHLHASVIAGIEESWTPPPLDNKDASDERERQGEGRRELIQLLSELRRVQQSALEVLNGQVQNTLCLLRHFSRMV